MTRTPAILMALALGVGTAAAQRTAQAPPQELAQQLDEDETLALEDATADLELLQDPGPPPNQRWQDQGWRRLQPRPGQRVPPARNFAAQNFSAQAGALPDQLTIAPGTFVTIRVNQVLSSDVNQQGDAFSASLVKPIVVDGIVVADRGQTIAGRVSEAKKAGRIKGTSRLGIELTELTLMDGAQVPLQSQLVTHEGPGSVGRDATAIGAATGVGAIVGAAADGGQAAGLGAVAGAGAAAIGVLLTRGRPTLIFPESVLTFRVEQPVTISTTRAPQAFRNVGPGDYNQPGDQPRTVARVAPGYGWGGPGWGWGGPRWGPGWGWGYPGFYGPRVGVGFVYGRGFGYGPRFGYGRRRW